jgi:hypothetical protein
MTQHAGTYPTIQISHAGPYRTLICSRTATWQLYRIEGSRCIGKFTHSIFLESRSIDSRPSHFSTDCSGHLICRIWNGCDDLLPYLALLISMHASTSNIVSFVGGLAVGAALAFALYKTSRLPRNSVNGRRSLSSVQNNQQSTSDDDNSQELNIYDDEVLQEMFTRNIQFFGGERQAFISKSFVVVVGLGVRPYTWVVG